MRILALTSAITLGLLLGACSGRDDDGEKAEGAASPPSSGTSLSIDTQKGAVSYESDNGTSSTSISVGGDGDDKSEKKPD